MEDSKITYRPSKHHPSRIRKELNNKMNDTIRKWAKVSSRCFSEEDTPMSNERRNRCPALLVIRELQIKTTLRYHFMPMRIAMTQKEKRNQAPAETEKSAPSPWLREYKMGQSVWKPACQDVDGVGSSAGVEHLGPEFDPNIGGRKLNMAITMRPGTPILGLHWMKSSINHDGWKEGHRQVSIDEWMPDQAHARSVWIMKK